MAACSKTTIPEEQKLNMLRWYSLNIIVYVVLYHADSIYVNLLKLPLFCQHSRISPISDIQMALYTWWPRITLSQL